MEITTIMQLSNPDHAFLVRSATRAAVRHCRKHELPWSDHEDVRQDLLLDLLTRLTSYDPARSSLPSFTAVCFKHRAARLADALRRDYCSRRAVPLDCPTTDTSGMSLADTLAETDGYSSRVGQPTEAFAALHRRLDLDRALSALPRDTLPICAALMRDGPDPAASAGMSRTTFYRRVHELRCQLLAAGIDGRRSTDRRVAE